MPSSSNIKREFLKKWIKGLKICSKARKQMSFLERKNAIKLSADIAMASTRMVTTSWSRTVLTKASQNESNKFLIEHIVGAEVSRSLKKSLVEVNTAITSKRNRCKKILRRSCTYKRVQKGPNRVVARDQEKSIAKRMVKKRTQLLKSLVPGGECMDEVSLMKETLDYVLALRLQVDVMRHLVDATAGKLDHCEVYI